MEILNISTCTDVDAATNTAANETCSNNGHFDFDCTAPNINDVVPAAVDIIQASLITIQIILGLLLNSFVVYLVVRFKSLQTRPYFLALQIVIVQLLYTVLVLPSMLVSAIAREWILGIIACCVIGGLHDLLVTVRYMLSLVLALDRTFTVLFPFRYQRYALWVCITMSVMAFSVGITRVVTALVLLECVTYIPTFKTCSAASCSNYCIGHSILFSSIIIVCGVIASILLYLLLFWKGYQLNKRLEIITEGAEAAEMERLRWQEHKRTIVTFVILVAVLVFCAFPPYVFYVLHFTLGLEGSSKALLILQILVGRTCLNSLSFADALVIMKNRDFREAINQLRWWRKLWRMDVYVVGPGVTVSNRNLDVVHDRNLDMVHDK